MNGALALALYTFIGLIVVFIKLKRTIENKDKKVKLKKAAIFLTVFTFIFLILGILIHYSR